MNEGWICPACGRGVAPDEKHCDHGGLGALPQLPQTFAQPRTLNMDCGCLPGQACGNVACPRMAQIVSGVSYTRGMCIG